MNESNDKVIAVYCYNGPPYFYPNTSSLKNRQVIRENLCPLDGCKPTIEFTKANRCEASNECGSNDFDE